MNIRNLFGIFTLTAFALVGCYSVMAGPGNMETDVLTESPKDLDAFENLRISGNFESAVVPSDRYRITVQGDEQDIENVAVSVSNNTLHVEQETNGRIFGRTPRIEIEIETPEPLKKVRLSGSNEAHIASAGTLESLRLSGSTRLHLDELNSENLSIRGSGSSGIEGNGTVETLEVRQSGSSRLNFEETITQDATLRTSGSSRVTLHVEEYLKVRSSGASRVYYIGNPEEIHTNTSGSATVKPAEQVSRR